MYAVSLGTISTKIANQKISTTTKKKEDLEIGMPEEVWLWLKRRRGHSRGALRSEEASSLSRENGRCAETPKHSWNRSLRTPFLSLSQNPKTEELWRSEFVEERERERDQFSAMACQSSIFLSLKPNKSFLAKKKNQTSLLLCWEEKKSDRKMKKKNKKKTTNYLRRVVLWTIILKRIICCRFRFRTIKKFETN